MALYNEKKDNLSENQYDLKPNEGYCLAKKETNATNRFKGKTIIITGAAGNFGNCCAERFASEGGNIALWDLKDPAEVKKTLTHKYKVTIKSYVVDVTDEDVVKKSN